MNIDLAAVHTLARHRMARYAAAGVVALIAIPAVPAIASALSPTDSSAGDAGRSAVVTLTVVDPSATAGVGLLPQQPAGQTVFIACPTGRVLAGGYEAPSGAKPPVFLASAPARDSSRWYFRSKDVVPIGTRYYAVCSG